MVAGEMLLSVNEMELIERTRQGDQQARQQLVQSYAEDMLRIINRFIHDGISFRPLLDQGQRTLLRCVQLFDSEKGVGFRHYALYWIKHDIYRMLETEMACSMQ